MNLQRVYSLGDLIRQVRENLDKGILCADPQLLEQYWGISLDGMWRYQTGAGEISTVFRSGKAFHPGPLERIEVIYEPQANLQIRFAPGQAAAGESLISQEELLRILGAPDASPDPLHPAPTPGTGVPEKSGPFPGSLLRWRGPPGIEITSAAGYGSEITNLTFALETKK